MIVNELKIDCLILNVKYLIHPRNNISQCTCSLNYPRIIFTIIKTQKYNVCLIVSSYSAVRLFSQFIFARLHIFSWSTLVRPSRRRCLDWHLWAHDFEYYGGDLFIGQKHKSCHEHGLCELRLQAFVQPSCTASSANQVHTIQPSCATYSVNHKRFDTEQGSLLSTKKK